MRLFANGMEIRLTHMDVQQLLQEAINNKFILRYKVDNLTLHPENKYVARLTIINPINKE